MHGGKVYRESTVITPDVEAFRKIAQEKVWPQYQKEYPDLWDEIVATKV